MIKADLSLFDEDLQGRKITGRIDGKKSSPIFPGNKLRKGR